MITDERDLAQRFLTAMCNDTRSDSGIEMWKMWLPNKRYATNPG